MLGSARTSAIGPDASYKTYYRSLSLLFPYTIDGGSEFNQSVAVTFDGAAGDSAADGYSAIAVTLGAGNGKNLAPLATSCARAPGLQAGHRAHAAPPNVTRIGPNTGRTRLPVPTREVRGIRVS